MNIIYIKNYRPFNSSERQYQIEGQNHREMLRRYASQNEVGKGRFCAVPWAQHFRVHSIYLKAPTTILRLL